MPRPGGERPVRFWYPAPENHIVENFHHFSPPFLQTAQHPWDFLAETKNSLKKSEIFADCAILERVTGIGPVSGTWQAPVLPLNYTRNVFIILTRGCATAYLALAREAWSGCPDSNWGPPRPKRGALPSKPHPAYAKPACRQAGLRRASPS